MAFRQIGFCWKKELKCFLIAKKTLQKGVFFSWKPENAGWEGLARQLPVIEGKCLKKHPFGPENKFEPKNRVVPRAEELVKPVLLILLISSFPGAPSSL